MDLENRHFIQQIIDEDLKNKKYRFIHTRFPPEPNGYLHFGHAKSIVLNFSLAEEYPNSLCNLRLDDTNPAKENSEYIDSIINDIEWLGYRWKARLYHASDYFDQLYDLAIQLIKKGLAFVDDLSVDEIKKYRGTLVESGVESPFRNRSIGENIHLFEEMKAGKYADGEKVLRAKIDMSSPNINMRDPTIYRIKHLSHPKTGDKWCIYPMYDYTHCLSDAIEGITHSLCTLEFEDHRPLYDWFIKVLELDHRPRQIEFARLNLTYTVMSKRKLLDLVEHKIVQGWDDPRMPTLSGMRRRGYTPSAIKEFCKRIGITKQNALVDYNSFLSIQREEFNKTSQRLMAVADPLKIVITNYPKDKKEWVEVSNNPEDKSKGVRKVSFSREIYIEREDFQENPEKKFHRLAPGREVRLIGAYYILCEKVIKNKANQAIELHCTYDPLTKGGWSSDGRKVKGTSHWVEAHNCVEVEIREYNHLFLEEDLSKLSSEEEIKQAINRESLQVKSYLLEPSFKNYRGQVFQFLRKGYFIEDKNSNESQTVFNRITTLKDSFKKKEGILSAR